MPKGTVKVICKICYDTKYNVRNRIFVENIDKHYEDSNNRRITKDQRIPFHPHSEDPKYYNIDSNGNPILNIKSLLQSKISTFFITKSPSKQLHSSSVKSSPSVPNTPNSKLLKQQYRNKPIYYLHRWEFIRLMFCIYGPQKKNSNSIKEILFLWERCLVMDCGEPSNEGSVSLLDDIIAGRGKLTDKVVDLWLKNHPSPICQSSKYIHSPTVDKILYSRNIKEVTSNKDIIL
jgi:hypothetical protein